MHMGQSKYRLELFEGAAEQHLPSLCKIMGLVSETEYALAPCYQVYQTPSIVHSKPNRLLQMNSVHDH